MRSPRFEKFQVSDGIPGPPETPPPGSNKIVGWDPLETPYFEKSSLGVGWDPLGSKNFQGSHSTFF